MSHPSSHARTDPAKPALIVAETGAVVTFADLDARSNRAAHLFRARGLAVLIARCRAELSGVKIRAGSITLELPRHTTGKLYKRLLRDRYRADLN